MKKAIMAVVIFILMAGTVGAFGNKPISWNGWAWEKTIDEVSRYLVVDYISESEDFAFYRRNGELNFYYGVVWDQVEYIFIKGKFEGVLLYSEGLTKMDEAYDAIRDHFGEPSQVVDVPSKQASARTWTEEYTFLTLIEDRDLTQPNTAIYIGTEDLGWKAASAFGVLLEREDVSLQDIEDGTSGWNGWAWGTKLKEVSKVLSKPELISSNQQLYFYSRADETMMHMGIRWNVVSYGFLDGSFAGVFLASNDNLRAQNALKSKFGEPMQILGDPNTLSTMLWNKGDFHVMIMSSKSEADELSIVAIGTLEFMKVFVTAAVEMLQL